MDSHPPNDSVLQELIALRLLDAADKPVGAVRLMQAWKAAGLPGAEATAGRFLRQLDDEGYTELRGTTRGRTLTESGKERLELLDAQRRRNEHQSQLWGALKATELSDLMDLLRMRRLVEVEAARLAAIRATDEELAQIALAADHHTVMELADDSTSPSMDFHRLIAHASHNRIVGAVALMLLDPSNDPLEKLLERISFEAGTTDAQLSDHGDLAQTLIQRNPDQAAHVMAMHMNRLIAAVQGFRLDDPTHPISNGQHDTID